MSRSWGKCVAQARYDTETEWWSISMPDGYEDKHMLAWYILTQIADDAHNPPYSPDPTVFILNLEIEWETLLNLDKPVR